MNTFILTTKILIGDSLSEVLDSVEKAFIVTDRFMLESGKTDYVTSRLDKYGIQYDTFAEISSEPDIEVVTAGVAKYTDFGGDTVIALGGGAAIDAAKAIVYFASKASNSAKPRFLAVPTTSGSGSEVSRFAVITDSKTMVKYPLIDDMLLPDYAVLDAALVVSAPASVTADSGIDVLTHAIEAFVSKNGNDFSEAMAEKAIKLVKHNLLKAYKNPEDLNARQGMHNASCLAGIAFSNSGLGINHSLAHAMGAKFHIPHGRANGILLPYVMSFNAGCNNSLTDTAEKYARVARLLNLESSSIRQSALNMIRVVKKYIGQLNIPPAISSAGISREQFDEALDEMAEAALADRCTPTNPVDVSLEDIKGIYQRAFLGKLS